MNNLKNKDIKKSVIIIAINILLFIILALTVKLGSALPTLDTKVTKWILTLRNSNLTDIMIFVTNLVSPVSIILMSLVIISYLYKADKKRSLLIFISTLILTFFLMQSTKLLIGRQRPPIDISLVTELSNSFPSGHTLFATVFYGLIFSYYYKISKSKHQKYLLSILGTIIVLSVGFSRIYLGVHWMSDVVGSYLIGSTVLILASLYSPRSATLQ